MSDLGFRFIDHSLELISPEALLFFNVFLDAFELKLLVVDFGSQTVEVGLVFSLKPLKLTPVFGFNALPVVRQLFANLLKVGDASMAVRTAFVAGWEVWPSSA